MSKLLMGFQKFLSFLLFAGFLVEGHEVESCGYCFSLFPYGDIIYPSEHLAREKPLDVFCLNMTGFAKCVENKDCFGSSPPVFILTDRYGYTFAEYIDNAVNITDEICSNGTQMYENYTQCVGKLRNNITEDCYQESLDASFHYRQRRMRDYSRYEYQKYVCLVETYEVGCLGNAIRDECGDSALYSFKETVGIFRHFEIRFCSTETLQNIATSFINSLNMTESRKKIYLECIM